MEVMLFDTVRWWRDQVVYLLPECADDLRRIVGTVHQSRPDPPPRKED